MAKSLRTKLAVGCIVAMSVMGAVPVFAQSNEVAAKAAVVNEVKTKDAWESEKEGATQFAAIKVLKANKDEASMASTFFTQTDLPVAVVDGKVVVKIQINKDGMGRKDAIKSLEQKVGNDYETLTLRYADEADVRYVVTDIKFEDIKEPVLLKCKIDIGFMTMTQELRIALTDETIAALKIK